MRVFLFTFWFLPDNRTAVNRIKYFKKKFIEKETNMHLLYCEDGIRQMHNSALFYKINNRHFCAQLYNYLLGKQWYMANKILHFIYLIIMKRDIYDFYHNFRTSESEMIFSFDNNDVVITSAPPYSALNIGDYLKRKYNLKWVIDYRDPWTLGYTTLGAGTFAYKLRKFMQRKEELRFLKYADQVLVVSESLKKMFPEEFQHKIHVIENGANTYEMNLSHINAKPLTFSIVYAGTIYPQQLENTYFFEVLKKFTIEQQIIPENMQVHFVGAADSIALKAKVLKHDLGAFVNITPRLELPVLYEFMYEASLFLHLKYADRDKIITSKQADYLALQKPILLPESDHGDLAESIFKNKAGYVCNNKDELYFTLQQEYVRFINHENIRIERDENFMKGISRNEASEKLLRLIYADLPLTETLKNEMELINRFYE